MKTITTTRFVTVDGHDFEDEASAVAHERAFVEQIADRYVSASGRSAKWQRAMRPVLAEFGFMILGHEDVKK